MMANRVVAIEVPSTTYKDIYSQDRAFYHLIILWGRKFADFYVKWGVPLIIVKLAHIFRRDLLSILNLALRLKGVATFYIMTKLILRWAKSSNIYLARAGRSSGGVRLCSVGYQLQ
jgi:hypothetical protein